MKQAIGYTRLSKLDEGKAGLGLEVQQKEIEEFCAAEGFDLVSIESEIQTGKGSDPLSTRPILAATLKRAKKEGLVVIVAKLDRLGRNVAFISTLMESKLRFIVTQLGADADPFMLHLYAVLSEKERELISQRTKAALGILKGNGVLLGNRTNLSEARVMGIEKNQANADTFALKVMPMIENYRADGVSFAKIADNLNSLGVKTRRGGDWYASTVSNILKRK
jgi:DNA invertase Pin-like site-specific DNA recombinase